MTLIYSYEEFEKLVFSSEEEGVVFFNGGWSRQMNWDDISHEYPMIIKEMDYIFFYLYSFEVFVENENIHLVECN